MNPGADCRVHNVESSKVLRQKNQLQNVHMQPEFMMQQMQNVVEM